MVTKAKIIRDINHIRTETEVKFKNFGLFFLKLMMLSIEDQEFIVDSLMNASRTATAEEGFVIHEITRPQVNLKESESSLRFMVVHEFKCKMCNAQNTEETNLVSGRFRDVCEFCMDKAQDYAMDQGPIDESDYYDR